LKINLNKVLTVSRYKTVLISIVLTLLMTPLLWVFSNADIDWILFANVISFTGTLILLYPFINYVYPYMITRMGTFLLTSLLTVVSIWLNITAISLSLPYDYIYEATLNTTIEKILIIGTTYIIVINALTLPLLYQEKKIESFF
jgi:hypothetical protein